jgi:hypothetical protein
MVVVVEQPARLPSVSTPTPIAAAVATDANALFITDFLTDDVADVTGGHVCRIERL